MCSSEIAKRSASMQKERATPGVVPQPRRFDRVYRLRGLLLMGSRRAAALLEIIGVFVTGTLAARMLARALGLTSAGLRDVQPGAAVDYATLAFTTGANLLLRYGII